ncbi:MAG TPA: TIGR00730 family Rossman fold protein [Saprospiraceae bacterium]|nr:TIGR00730 family Rossman fold protein [Saprospiraceae bacterium]HOY12512.1 TIGR00730 family Rossman fold protein [Saprospiraceae bacterium]HPN68323.1 TIGR00730 family Rossman fold protein [Saprospiraceae bacterium]
MQNIVVFCGSSAGNDPLFENQAKQLGLTLALNGIGLVYGGAKVGLMGAVANGALEGGGKVIGVLPNFLRSKEIAHQGLTQLITVESMHERKLKMSELCDGVIALPGGFGTLEEFFEMLTWAQLGLHKKPMGILNTSGYFDHLIIFLDHMTSSGLLRSENRAMILISEDIDDLLLQMKNYLPPTVGKWIEKSNT